jgi:hypothetical protein
MQSVAIKASHLAGGTGTLPRISFSSCPPDGWRQGGPEHLARARRASNSPGPGRLQLRSTL